MVEQVSKKNEAVNIQALNELGHSELAKQFKEKPILNKAFDNYNAEKDADIALFREEYREEKRELTNQKVECTRLKDSAIEKMTDDADFDFNMDDLISSKPSSQSLKK